MLGILNKRIVDLLCKANFLFLTKGKNKKGDMEIEEIVKIAIVVLLIVVTVGFLTLFRGKGGEMIASIKKFMRFG